MKKLTILILIVLGLLAIGLAALVLVSNAGDRGPSVVVSGHAAKHHKVAVVRLPPVSTTTTTTTATTPVTAVTRETAGVPATLPAKTPTTTTTAPALKVVSPTTTTTVPLAASNVTVQTSTTGVMTSPDKGECSAGIDQECALVTSSLRTGNMVAIVVTDASGNVLGTLTVQDYGQNDCLIHWLSRATGTVGSSSDCTGGPLTSNQVGFDFNYRAAS